MKRFSKFQKISSIVLAIIMTLSVFLPYAGTVVLAADDLTGWDKSASSTVTGNPTEGWRLSLAGSGLTSSDNTCYSSSYKVSELRVLMDLSTMADGQEFWMTFGYGKYGLASWDGAKVIFAFTRKGDKLELYGHNGSAELGKTTIDFNFGKEHIFEFVQDANQKWQLAIDNTIYPMGDTNGTSVDYFVNYMNNTLGANVKVGFINRKSTATVINKVQFGDKSLEADDTNDLTGWDKSASSAITGNPADGWQLSLVGSGLTSSDNTCYSSSYKASELRVLMDLSTMTDGQEFWMTFGYGKYGLASWDGAKVIFAFTRKGDKLELYGHNGSAELGKTTIDLDFNRQHIVEFVQDANQKWQLAIDEVIYPMGDTNTTSVDYFVNYMNNTLGANVKVGFISRKSTATVINKVKFGDKSLEPEMYNDLTGWDKSAGSAITGTPEEGWNLTLSGSGLTSSDNTCYSSSYKASELRVLMDLSTMTDGQEFWMTFGYGKYGLASWDGAKVIFAFTRKGDKLELYGHNGSAELGKTTIDLDFNRQHIFEFVQDANQKWQLAIDNTIYPMGDTDGTSVDYFVNYMNNTLGANVKVGFISRKSTATVINKVKFGDKTLQPEVPNDLTGWEQGATSVITGNSADGWTLSMAGNVWSGSQYGNYYTSNLAVSDLQMTFDLSELVTGKNVWLVVADAKGAPGEWSDTKASFIMKKIDDTTLEFVGHTGSTEIGIKAKIIGFDFTALHTLTFERKGQNYYPAIDGTRYDIDCTEFIKGMEEKSSETTVFGFGPQSDEAIVIKNIKFSEKPFDPNNHIGWVLGTTSVLAIFVANYVYESRKKNDVAGE